MTADPLDELESLLAEAAPLPLHARAAFIETRCAGRDALRADLQSLLAAHDAAGGFLDPVTLRSEPDLLNAAADCGIGVGSRLGPYLLVEAIGEGGMGTVYRAERDDGAFTRQVAVKVIATPNASAARRFRLERQVLARLQHPHIVTLFDGGTSASGHAYLVMEYVPGVPITAYCADRRLTLDARLHLFRRVCEAVQHAHERKILHRDLKPSNILVLDDGTPKLLDFGVAKLLEDAALPGQTLTLLGPGPMTPNYASPEQLRGLPLGPTADVYALGVLLYEIVSGVRPYDTTNKLLDELLDTVLRAAPVAPSAAASDRLPYDGRTIGRDLDAIVLKALAKPCEARYATAGELAADIGRVLGREPVVARAPQSQTRRWLRTAIACAALVLAAVLAVTWPRIGDGTDAGRQRGGTSNATARAAYERGMQLWRTPSQIGRATAAFREAIAADPSFALAYVGLADAYAIQNAPSPEAESALGEAMRLAPGLGEAYATQGFIRLFHYWDWLGAEQALTQATELAPGYAQAHHWLGFHLMIQRRFDEARRSLEHAAQLDPQSPAILTDLGLLAYYQGQDERAEPMCRQTLAMQPRFAFAINCLEHLFERQGRYREAALLSEADVPADFGRSQWQAMLRSRLPPGKPGAHERYDIARLYARLDEREPALRWLNEGLATHTFSMPFVNVDPPFDRYRSDPAFIAILQAMGLR